MKSRLPIICIMGCTCTGKTELAISLQKSFPIEIISVDSAMIYKELDIGTDKPSNEILNTVKHHLINIRKPNEDYNVGNFYKDTEFLIKDIHMRNKIPLLVGGSLMYFNSLYKGLSDLPDKNVTERELIDYLASKYSLRDLHYCLKHIDLTSYNKINPNDSQRIQRAIEVYLTTGKPISSFFDNKKNFLDAYDVITIQMHSKERLFVHERIESRTREMFQRGLIEEVEFVSRKYNLTLRSKSMKIIGYKQVLEFLENSGNFDDLVNQCIFATHQLAKRQITWLKQFPSDIEVDIKNFDPNIIHRLVDSHCNLSK